MAKLDEMKKKMDDFDELKKRQELLEELRLKRDAAFRDLEEARIKLEEIENSIKVKGDEDLPGLRDKLEDLRKKSEDLLNKLKKELEDLENSKRKREKYELLMKKLKTLRDFLFGILKIILIILPIILTLLLASCALGSLFNSSQCTFTTGGEGGTGESDGAPPPEDTGGTTDTVDTQGGIGDILSDVLPVVVPTVIGVGVLGGIAALSNGSTQQGMDADGYAEGYRQGMLYAQATVQKATSQGNMGRKIVTDDDEYLNMGQAGGAAGSRYNERVYNDTTISSDDMEDMVYTEPEKQQEDVYADEEEGVLSTENVDLQRVIDNKSVPVPYPIPVNLYQQSVNQGFLDGYYKTKEAIEGLRDIRDGYDAGSGMYEPEDEQYSSGQVDVEEEPEDEQQGGGSKSSSAKKWLKKMEQSIKRKTRKQTALFQEYKTIMNSLKSDSYHTSTLKMGK
jgi:hypothetical protein